MPKINRFLSAALVHGHGSPKRTPIAAEGGCGPQITLPATKKEKLMDTANIVKFLQTTYTDEDLAALLAHAQPEPGEDPARKLSFFSCCCFIGVPSAPHALRGYVPEFAQGRVLPAGSTHHQSVRLSSGLAADAEEEFFFLGSTDAERRERLVPLIEAEIARREQAGEIETQRALVSSNQSMDLMLQARN
jgi:hypothetical protein